MKPKPNMKLKTIEMIELFTPCEKKQIEKIMKAFEDFKKLMEKSHPDGEMMFNLLSSGALVDSFMKQKKDMMKKKINSLFKTEFEDFLKCVESSKQVNAFFSTLFLHRKEVIQKMGEDKIKQFINNKSKTVH